MNRFNSALNLVLGKAFKNLSFKSVSSLMLQVEFNSKYSLMAKLSSISPPFADALALSSIV